MTTPIDPSTNLLTDAFQAKVSDGVRIWDQTLRDGEQMPGLAFTRDEKIELARLLDALGVCGFNAGFPAMSSYESETIRALKGLGLRCEIGGLARLRRDDFDAAMEVGCDWIQAFVATSDSHINDKLKTTVEEQIAKLKDVVPYGVEKGFKVSVAIEDATRTPLPRLLRFLEVCEEVGASMVRIADTVGVLTPSATYRLFGELRSKVSSKLCVHFHDDLGLAVANTIAAFEAGADVADATLLGIGERAGNTSLEELAVALKVKYGVDAGIDTERLPEAAHTTARYTGLPVPPNKAVVGDNVFSHESGIHVAGVLANPVTYNGYPPELVGRENRFIFGKHSGTAGLKHLLAREGIELSDERQQALLSRIKAAGQDKQLVPETRVLEWAREEVSA